MTGLSSVRVSHLLGGAVAALIWVPNPVAGQTAAERAVRATVDTFFAAIAREQWDSAAAMLEPKQFESFFKRFVSNVRSAIPQRPLTVEDLMAMDSTMTRAVAEWQIGQIKQRGTQDQFAYLSSQFAGITTPRELFALAIPAAAARWIEAQDERTQMRETWRRQDCSLSDLPAFPPVKHTVLAVALADDSTAYVVHTDDRFGSTGRDNMSSGERLMKLHRTNGRWRIEPREDLLQPHTTRFFSFDCPKVRKP